MLYRHFSYLQYSVPLLLHYIDWTLGQHYGIPTIEPIPLFRWKVSHQLCRRQTSLRYLYICMIIVCAYEHIMCMHCENKVSKCIKSENILTDKNITLLIYLFDNINITISCSYTNIHSKYFKLLLRNGKPLWTFKRHINPEYLTCHQHRTHNLFFQHFLTMVGGDLAVTLVFVKAMCVTENLDKAQIFGTVLFGSGLATILQSLVGSRWQI